MRTGTGRTHIGNVRSNNQDTICVSDGPLGVFDAVFIVADGMGGHLAGEVASAMAAKAFHDYLAAADDAEDTENLLKKAAWAANLTVYEASVKTGEYAGMGTTLSAVAEYAGGLYYVHIGDSRIYTVSEKGITQVSNDHSYVAEMVRMGNLSEDEARVHPKKNVLLRALGTEPSVEADTGKFLMPDGGRALICSDGLSNMVDDKDIMAIINKDAMTDEGRADELLRAALENGGKDNISFVIIA